MKMTLTPKGEAMKYREFAGVQIDLDDKGRFIAADVEGERLESDTYEKITAAITATQRRALRVKAASIAVVALLRSGSAFSSEASEQFVEATFRGLNAHTGDTMLTVNGNKESHSAPWLCRPDDPALPKVKALHATREEARKAYKVAEDALTTALKTHGVRPQRGYGYGTDRNAAAAEVEEQVIAALGARP